jgi:transposase
MNSKAMHITRLRSKRSDGRVYETVLVAQSYRENGKVKKRTICNITHLPKTVQDLIALSLKGESFILNKADSDEFKVMRSLAHGNVIAVLGMMKQLKMSQLLDRSSSRVKDIVLALIASQLLFHSSKLSSLRQLEDTTLLSMLGLTDVSVDELYSAMDWLGENQHKIEKRLAQRHLKENSLALYDLTSSYFEGTKCPIAKYGYSRDQKSSLLQIEYGVLTNESGIPIGVEVVEGNTLDAKTVKAQLDKLTSTFKLKSLVFVGDRGMLTETNIDSLKELGGIDFISAIKRPRIMKLVKEGQLQLSLFDKVNLAEITDPNYPSERLIVCKNPYVADANRALREKIIASLEEKLEKLVKSIESGHLSSTESIAMKVGQTTSYNRAKKYLNIKCSDNSLTFTRKQDLIDEESKLDGIYILRTSVDAATMDTPDIVKAYKSLSRVEHVFHTMKSINLAVRPIRHWNEHRVRSHIFLCMLSYYVQYHLEESLKELLFTDENKDMTQDPVLKQLRSESADKKAQSKLTSDGLKVNSFKTLLDHMASLRLETIGFSPADKDLSHQVEITTEPTDIQNRVLELIGINKMGNVVSQLQYIT